MAIAPAENGVAVRPADTTATPSIGSAPTGDMLVAICSSDGTGDPSISGSGWAEIVNAVNGVSQRMKVWWKVAGASEPTSVTFTFGGATAIMGFLGRWTGAHATTPYVNDSNGASGSDNAPAPGSAGGSGADYLIAAYYYSTGAVGPSSDDGYTQIAFDDSQGTLVVLEKTSTSATSPTFGTDTSDGWVAFNSGWDEAVGAAILRRRRME